MKEIKFRAWDKIFKIMFEVSEISLGNNSYVKGLGGQFSRGDCFILMQYTGLKDKNGKEIYFGDILKLSNIDQFFYENEYTYFLVKDEIKESFGSFSKIYGFETLGPLDDCEVVGNIKENPELLETK